MNFAFTFSTLPRFSSFIVAIIAAIKIVAITATTTVASASSEFFESVSAGHGREFRGKTCRTDICVPLKTGAAIMSCGTHLGKFRQQKKLESDGHKLTIASETCGVDADREAARRAKFSAYLPRESITRACESGLPTSTALFRLGADRNHRNRQKGEKNVGNAIVSHAPDSAAGENKNASATLAKTSE